jgi:hypothetical protein
LTIEVSLLWGQLTEAEHASPATTWLYVMDSNNDRVEVFDITNS